MNSSSARTVLTRAKTGKVLIVEDDLSLCALLSTLLTSMGCECVATSSGKAVAFIEREAFDAVVVDLDSSEAPAVPIVLRSRELEPNLCGRILVITDEVPDPRTTDLIELHSLTSLPRNRLIQQLWSSLQSLWAFPRSQDSATERPKIARLIFDSFRQPLVAGVRSSHNSVRQLVFEHDKIRVDMAIEPLVGLGRIALIGQVLDAAEPQSKSERLGVDLMARNRPLASTTLNQFGEFNLEFDFVESADLRFRRGGKSWVSIPSINMAWAKRRSLGAEV